MGSLSSNFPIYPSFDRTVRQLLRPGQELVRTAATLTDDYEPGTYWAFKSYGCGPSSDASSFSWVTMLPRGYRQNSLRFRIWWMTGNTDTGNVEWDFTYTGASGDGEVINTTSEAPAATNMLDAASGIDNAVQVTSWFTPDTDEPDWTEDKLVSIWWRRNGIAAADTYTGTAYVIGVEVEYQVDNQNFGGLNQAEVDARNLYGTFTPTIQDASKSDAEGQTYSNQSGAYIKTPTSNPAVSKVEFWIDLTITSKGTLTGSQQVYIAGLPFLPDRAVAVEGVGYANNLSIAANASLSGVIGFSTSEPLIRMYNWNLAAGHSWFLLSELVPTCQIIVHGSYLTAE